MVDRKLLVISLLIFLIPSVAGVNLDPEIKYYELNYEIEMESPESFNATVTVSLENTDKLNRVELDISEEAQFKFKSNMKKRGDKYIWNKGDGENFLLRYEVKLDKGDFNTTGENRWGIIKLAPPLTIESTNLDSKKIDSPRTKPDMTVEGEGFGARHFAYIGKIKKHRFSSKDQNFTVGIPPQAKKVPKTKYIQKGLKTSSNRLEVLQRSEEVNFIVVPSDSFSLSPLSSKPVLGSVIPLNTIRKRTDAWVRQKVPVRQANSVWIHEYIHTRQGETGENMHWWHEASASYYASLYAYQSGLINYTTFKKKVLTGSYREEALVGSDEGVMYGKGSHVLAALDMKIRKSTNGLRSLENVFWRVNRRETDYKQFRKIVNKVSGVYMGGWIDKYVNGSKVPEISPEKRFFNDLTIDTDDDGFPNWYEKQVSDTDPVLKDTDVDGLNDRIEFMKGVSNPLESDTDEDGFKDGIELERGTDPKDKSDKPDMPVRKASRFISGVGELVLKPLESLLGIFF